MTIEDLVNKIQYPSLRKVLEANPSYPHVKNELVPHLKAAVERLDWTCDHRFLENEKILPKEFYSGLHWLCNQPSINVYKLTRDDACKRIKGLSKAELNVRMSTEEQINRIQDYRIKQILKSNSRYDSMKESRCSTLSRAILDMSWASNHERLSREGVDLGHFYGLIYNMAHGTQPQLETADFDDIIAHLQGRKKMEKKPYFPELQKNVQEESSTVDTPVQKTKTKKLLI